MKLVNIKLHGHLGETIGKNWNLAVSSAGEAIHAIQTLNGKLYKYLVDKDKEGAKYRVLINGRDFRYNKKPDINDLESIRTSELAMKKKLESVDIVPVLEGAGSDWGAIVIGALLIIVGIITIFAGGSGAFLIIAGIGLIAAGVINLLSSPPKFEDFRAISGGGRPSYLFAGPQNTTNEGGPVPIGYGRLIVGSQVIAASYEVTNRDASEEPLTT
jgi:predicted phage tail protein